MRAPMCALPSPRPITQAGVVSSVQVDRPARQHHTQGDATTMCHHSTRSDTPPLAELLKGIASAASNGATYPWIAGVLARCLAEQTTTTEARAAAIATFSRPPLEGARQRAA